ncbi:MAG: DUF1559 domain-containing protein [Pirellulaceae bacterium]
MNRRLLAGLLLLGLLGDKLLAQPPTDQNGTGDTNRAASEEPADAPTLVPSFDEFPDDYDSLVKVKSNLIELFREADSTQAKEQAIKHLGRLFAVELKLLRMAEQELDNENVALVETFRQTPQEDGGLLAYKLYQAGDYVRSAEVYDTVLQIAKRRKDLSLEAYNDLHWLKYRSEQLAEAEPARIEEYQQALKTLVEAEALLAAEQFDKAADRFNESVTTQREIAGIAPKLASEYASLATALNRSNQFEAAEQAYMTALDIYDQTIGKENNRYAASLYNLAIFYRDQKRLDEAEAAFSETRMIESRLGIDVPSQLMTLNELAGIYRQTEEAEKFDNIVFHYRKLERQSIYGLEALQRYLPLETYAAASFDPAAFIERPSLKHLPHELLLSAAQSVLGIDLSDVQTAVGFVMLASPDDPFGWGVLLKPNVGVALDVRLPEDIQELSSGGIAYQKATTSDLKDTCFAKLPDRTVVIGRERALRSVLAMSKKEPDAIADKNKASVELHSLHGSGDIVTVFDVAKVHFLAKAIADEAPPLPEPVAKLKALPDHLDTASLTFSFDRSPYASLRLTPRADSSLEELDGLLRPAIDFGINEMTAVIMSSIGERTPLQSAIQRFLNRIIEGKREEMAPKVEGRQLVIDVERMLDVEAALHAPLLLPAVEGFQSASDRTISSNNLRQIGLAMHIYHDRHGKLPARELDANGKASQLSWRVHLLPYLDQEELYQQFHLDEPWDSEHNKTLISKMPDVFVTPGTNSTEGTTSYLTLDGDGTWMQDQKEITLSDVRDGLSSTIAVVEADEDKAVVWTRPVDLAFSPSEPLEGLGKARPEGFQVLLGDGAVRTEPADVSPSRIAAMATIAGGEIVNE